MTEKLLNAVEFDLANRGRRLKFSPVVETRFEADTKKRRERSLVFAGLIALLIYDLFLFNDYAIRPEAFFEAAWLRLGVMTPYGLLTLWLIEKGPSPVIRENLAASAIIVAMFLACTIFYISESRFPTLDAFSFGLVLLVGNIFYSMRFSYAVGSSLICMVFVFVAVMAYQDIELEEKSFALMMMTSIAIFTLLANYRLESSERQSYLLLLRETLRNGVALKDNQTLTQISFTDPLTQLANRRQLDETLPLRWEEALACGGTLGLLMIDVDNFKAYNDHYGHPQGDECLRRVAEVMQHQIRKDADLIVRFGGEEFVVLLPGASSSIAAQAAERIRRSVESLALPNEGTEYSIITVSVGIAVCQPSKTMPTCELLSNADSALYEAKRAGRNRSVVAA